MASDCAREAVIEGGHCISDLIRSQQNTAVGLLEGGRGGQGG
ncbi:MAG TPA: hypothetical protein VFA63_08425 [Pseudonocardiaceae bacterium]|nr:hypothetical protein [Pseudonocardiaceae bacterium]